MHPSAENELPAQDLVLVGGGHAHVQVLRRWMMSPLSGVQLTLVVDRPVAVYSGMVPGLVAGDYRQADLEIDVVPLARRARARVLLSAATRIDPDARLIHLDCDRPPLPYDVASLDVGSTVRGLDLPGVREHALATRPIGRFVERIEAWFAAHEVTAREIAITIVGSGAGGVELAFAMAARMRQQGKQARVTLLDRNSELLRGHGVELQRRVRQELDEVGVALRLGVSVAEVTASEVVLASSAGRVPSDLTLWVTGAAPPALIARSPLPVDARGFVLVDDTLQVLDCPGLFACGDCAAMERHPWVPKAGVYAVREGPYLADNLRASLEGNELEAYTPQRDFLALLNQGNHTALGEKWGRVISGPWVWKLKDRIDRRFMRKFQVLEPSGKPSPHVPTSGEMGMDEMPCGGCAAKVGPALLSRVLGRLEVPPHPTAPRGLEARDDVATVLTAGGEEQLITIDGFRAFVDDPHTVGRAAVVNALSDVWAKGGTPRQALTWVLAPPGPDGKVEELLFQLLSGVQRELRAHDVALAGGHTTQGAELSIGISVLATPGARFVPKTGLAPGNKIYLSKALGTGAILHADMLGEARGSWLEAALASILEPNARVARWLAPHASAATDVTGFGLAVHLLEMLGNAPIAVELTLAHIPALPGALELLGRGVRSTFHPQNRHARHRIQGLPSGSARAELLFDPQTSGGLLFGLPPEVEVPPELGLHEIGRVREREAEELPLLINP